MSGTSLDGVDAAWLETDGLRIGRTGPSATFAYDALLRSDLRRLLDLAPGLSEDDPFLHDVTGRLTERHAEAVAALGVACDIIGFHGQTILHQPWRRPDRPRRTWQIGDAAALVRACGVTVAHDFRSADVAAGGEGAPLVPIFHMALAHALPRPLAVLNLGGVGNVTYIGVDGGLLAFDTGPGNGPLDDWAARHSNLAIDRDGALSAAGQVDVAVLGQMMMHPYFRRPGPKSLDRLDFSASLASSGLESLAASDGAATLVAFTAEAVAQARLPAPPLRWLVTGGGRHNPSIMAALRQRLAVKVDPVEAVGWDGDALEAQCFAFLAVRTFRRLPISFPGTTGAPRALLGGRLAALSPPPAP